MHRLTSVCWCIGPLLGNRHQYSWARTSLPLRTSSQIQGSCQTTTFHFNKIRPDTPFVTPASMLLDREFTSAFFDALLLANGIPDTFSDVPLFTETLGIMYIDKIYGGDEI